MSVEEILHEKTNIEAKDEANAVNRKEDETVKVEKEEEAKTVEENETEAVVIEQSKEEHDMAVTEEGIEAVINDQQTAGEDVPPAVSLSEEIGGEAKGSEVPPVQLEKQRSNQSRTLPATEKVTEAVVHEDGDVMHALPEMEEAGGEGKGSELPQVQLEKQRSNRSNRSSARNLVRSSTYNRPASERPSIQSVNSMPCSSRSIKSKKPPTFGRVFGSAQVVSLPNDTKGNIPPLKIREARELAKFAVKALDMKDTDIARKRLQEALSALNH